MHYWQAVSLTLVDASTVSLMQTLQQGTTRVQLTYCPHHEFDQPRLHAEGDALGRILGLLKLKVAGAVDHLANLTAT